MISREILIAAIVEAANRYARTAPRAEFFHGSRAWERPELRTLNGRPC